VRSCSVQGNPGSSAKLTSAFFVIPKHAYSLAFSEKYVFAPIDRHGGDHIQVTLNESLLSKSKTVCGEDLMALGGHREAGEYRCDQSKPGEIAFL